MSGCGYTIKKYYDNIVNDKIRINNKIMTIIFPLCSKNVSSTKIISCRRITWALAYYTFIRGDNITFILLKMSVREYLRENYYYIVITYILLSIKSKLMMRDLQKIILYYNHVWRKQVHNCIVQSILFNFIDLYDI